MFLASSCCKGECQGTGLLAPWGGPGFQQADGQAASEEKQEERVQEEEEQEEHVDEDEHWFENLDMTSMDMVALWNEPRQEVNLAGVAGTYPSGCTYGIWFNAGRAAPKDWSKRVYKPAWYDENDDRETFAWKKPAGLAPCEAEWNKADEVLPRFKLTAQHKVPTDQCERMKDILKQRTVAKEPVAKKAKR